LRLWGFWFVTGSPAVFIRQFEKEKAMRTSFVQLFVELVLFLLTILLDVSIFLYIMHLAAKRKKRKFFRRAILASLFAISFSMMVKMWKKKDDYPHSSN